MVTIDYSDIIGSDFDTESEHCEVPLLVEPRKIQGYLGFTLNHPRTVKFLNASSTVQKKIYTLWVLDFKNTFGITSQDDIEICFEYCQSGQIHLHGYMKVQKNGFINGFVSDLTKSILKYLPNKYFKYSEASLHPSFHRYRCPSVVVQWYDSDETIEGKGGISHWKTYIKKQQDLNVI